MARKEEAWLRVAGDEVGERERGGFCRTCSQGKSVGFTLNVTGNHCRD